MFATRTFYLPSAGAVGTVIPVQAEWQVGSYPAQLGTGFVRLPMSTTSSHTALSELVRTPSSGPNTWLFRQYISDPMDLRGRAVQFSGLIRGAAYHDPATARPAMGSINTGPEILWWPRIVSVDGLTEYQLSAYVDHEVPPLYLMDWAGDFELKAVGNWFPPLPGATTQWLQIDPATHRTYSGTWSDFTLTPAALPESVRVVLEFGVWPRYRHLPGPFEFGIEFGEGADHFLSSDDPLASDNPFFNLYIWGLSESGDSIGHYAKPLSPTHRPIVFQAPITPPDPTLFFNQ